MTDHQMLRKVRTSIDSRYGKAPEDRSVDELLVSGTVVIDKPMGPTSHQVTAWVRDMLGADKAAHGGTLDPRVTGVLPIGLGAAVRAMDYVHEDGKRYIGVIRLHHEVDDDSLESVLEDFKGEIYQVPPVRSSVRRSLRTRRIYSLDMLEREGSDVLIDVRCEGGTYIRTLAVDIGDALGVGAHLQDLRRIEAGAFKEDQAVTLHELKDSVEAWRAEGDDRPIRRHVMPMERVFSLWKRIVVRDSAVDAICHGADLAVPGIAELAKDIGSKEKVAIFTLKGEIVATGVAVMNSDNIMHAKEGTAVTLERVFMRPGTYPRLWSRISQQKPHAAGGDALP